MNETIEKLFEKIPRVRIGFFPTPLEKLENFSRKYDVELYMKRDDLTGPGFGGNKIRKIEFVLGDALKKDAKYLITYGGFQTNHGRQLVASCRKFGLEPILYLIGPNEPEEFRGNLLLDKIMNAEIHYVIPKTMDLTVILKQATDEAKSRIDELEAKGHKCYDCPAGAFNPPGSLGFLWGFNELMDQLKEKGLGIDYIVHASGTGGTLTGLLMGRKLLHSDIKILPFSVAELPPDMGEKISSMSGKVSEMLGVDVTISKDEVKIDDKYYGPGYDIPYEGSTEAIKELAREEGVILGPAYTAKAMSGLLDYIKKGEIPKGSKIVFWHTGGTPTIFAEKEIVGKVYD